MVRAGTYTGEGNTNLTFRGKGITVKSEEGPEATIIDCEWDGRGFIFNSGEDKSAQLIGFTVQNCRTDDYGGGIYVDSSSPRIENCIIQKNEARHRGGGIAIVSGSSPHIIGCLILDNRVLSGMDGKMEEGDGGAGIYINASFPFIEDSEIRLNSIEDTSDSGPIFYGGGGILLDGNSDAVIKNSIIAGNELWNSAGGGIAVKDSSAKIDECLIENNYASHQARPGYDTGGGIILVRSSPVISNSIIRGNDAYNGGGIEIGYGSSPIIVNTMIVQNTAGDGGGVRVTSCKYEPYDCLASEPRFIFCTFANNNATFYPSGGGGALKIMNNESHVTILNSILWGDVPDEINKTATASVTVGYSDVEGGWEGDQNMYEDPKFKNSWGDDYHLTVQQSPCINKGIRLDEIDRDFEGTQRPSGRGYDLGADEAGGLVWRPRFKVE